MDNASLEVGKAGFATCLAADVEKDRSAGLIVGAVEEVALLESLVRVRYISPAVGEVIDLVTSTFVSYAAFHPRTHWLINGMSRILSLALPCCKLIVPRLLLTSISSAGQCACQRQELHLACQVKLFQQNTTSVCGVDRRSVLYETASADEVKSDCLRCEVNAT